MIAEEVESDALAALVINVMRGTLKACAVKAPGFGSERRKAMLQDIAVLTGAQLISDELGLTLAKARPADLGRARRVEVGKDDTAHRRRGRRGRDRGAHRQHPPRARQSRERLRARSSSTSASPGSPAAWR